MTITAMSVLIALLIGGIEALGLLAQKFEMEGRFWTAVGNLNESLGIFGLLAIAAFALCWIASALIYSRKGYEELGRVPLA
jgi:high-affinity nickel-transport protein